MNKSLYDCYNRNVRVLTMGDSYSLLIKGNITKGVSVVRLTYSRLNLRGEEWYAEGPLLTVIELRLKMQSTKMRLKPL